MLSDTIIPCTNTPDPDARLYDPDEGELDEVSRTKRRCTKNRMVVVDDLPRRCTIKVCQPRGVQKLAGLHAKTSLVRGGSGGEALYYPPTREAVTRSLLVDGVGSQYRESEIEFGGNRAGCVVVE